MRRRAAGIRFAVLTVGLISLVVLLVGGAALRQALAAALQSAAIPPPDDAVRVKVLRVVDGDTIVVERFGHVRYIGVDTPETKHPRKPVQRYGQEATAANRELVLGRTVALEFDVQRQDRYGRTLAYVYVDRTFVNAALIESGYAQVATFPPNVRYVQLFRSLQAKARVAGTGLWSPPAAKAAEQ